MMAEPDSECFVRLKTLVFGVSDIYIIKGIHYHNYFIYLLISTNLMH